jgi:uncharacterized protein YeaO (DUF488 family)
MSETTPPHNDADWRGRVVLQIWPRGYKKQGKRIDTDDNDRCPAPDVIDLEVCDAELLAAEWGRQPYWYENEGSKSIRTALREREIMINMEDLNNAQDEG